MTFAGINYLAVIIAAVVAWVAGAVWYGLLANPWVATLPTYSKVTSDWLPSLPAESVLGTSILLPLINGLTPAAPAAVMSGSPLESS